VRVLLQHGADVDTFGESGMTPIRIATEKGDLKLAKLLLDNGANFKAGGDCGHILLQITSKIEQTEMVQLLLEAGADPDSPVGEGWVLLTRIAELGYTESLEVILRTGCYIEQSRSVTGSLLVWTVRKGRLDLLKRLHQGHNIDWKEKDWHGRTLLHIATGCGHLHIYQYLIEQGLDPYVKDANGDDLLSYAAVSGSLEMLDAVLALIPMVPVEPRHRWSLLHWACRAGNVHCVKRLLSEGLRMHCVSRRITPTGHWRPSDMAILHGHNSMLADLSESSRALLGRPANNPQQLEVGSTTCHGCFRVSRVQALYGCNCAYTTRTYMAHGFDVANVHISLIASCAKRPGRDFILTTKIQTAGIGHEISIWRLGIFDDLE
jgi:ankyrin repeat protein